MDSKKSHQTSPQDLQRYADAFAFMPGYAYMLDEGGKLVDCNQNLLKQLDLSSVENHTVGAIYRLMQDHGFGNEYQITRHKKDDINALMTESPHTSEEPIPLWLHREETHWFEVQRQPLRDPDGKLEGLLVTLRDISNQEHLQEQFTKLKKELQQSNRNISEKFDFDPHVFASEKPPTVLLIEDNFLAQKAAKSVLMSCDCEVDVVRDERELKAVFEPGKYQFVLMDIGLEGTSGYMLAKTLRQQEEGSKHHVPIVALTGFDAEVIREDCAHYDMEGAIAKPLTVEQVKQLVQRYVKHIDIEISGLYHKKK